MPQPLYSQGKIPWYPLYRRLGETQSQSGHGVEKNSQPPLGIESQSSDQDKECVQIVCCEILYKMTTWKTKNEVEE